MSIGLVTRLCLAFKKDGNMLEKLRAKDELKEDLEEKVHLVAEDMLKNNNPIWKAKQV